MQVTLEEIENKLRQLSVGDLRKVLETVDSLLEAKEAKHAFTKERLNKLKENIENLEKVLLLKGKVEKIRHLHTFVPKSDSLKWRIKDKNVDLQNAFRYLTLVENTGKIGWARIVKTRITKFHDGVKSNIPITFNEKEYKVGFKANWNEKTISDYNLEIELTSESFPRLVCKILVWFNLVDLEIIEIKIIPQNPIMEELFDTLLPPLSNDSFEEIKFWIEKNSDIFKKQIISELLKPFKYEKNLAGKDAISFLGYEKECELKIGNIQNQNILIFKILNLNTNYAIFI